MGIGRNHGNQQVWHRDRRIAILSILLNFARILSNSESIDRIADTMLGRSCGEDSIVRSRFCGPAWVPVFFSEKNESRTSLN